MHLFGTWPSSQLDLKGSALTKHFPCVVKLCSTNNLQNIYYSPEGQTWKEVLKCWHFLLQLVLQMIPGSICLAVLASSVLYYPLNTIFHLDLEEIFQLSDSSDCSGLNLSKGIHHITRKDVVWGSKNMIPFDSPKLQACPLRAASCWE